MTVEAGDVITVAGCYEADRRSRWLRIVHWVIGHKHPKKLQQFRVTQDVFSHTIPVRAAGAHSMGLLGSLRRDAGLQQKACDGCSARTDDAFVCSYCGRFRCDPEMLRDTP